MIVTGIVLAAAVGLLRGGSLKRLEELGLKAFPLVWAAIILRVAAGALSQRGVAPASWLQVAAYVLLIYMVLANHRQPGMKTFGFGSFLNFLVITANGGKMPVSAAAIARAGLSAQPSGTHTLLAEGTLLPFLADIIPVPLYLPLRSVVSIGDIFIVLGIFAFIQYRMLAPAKPAALVPEKD